MQNAKFSVLCAMEACEFIYNLLGWWLPMYCTVSFKYNIYSIVI